MKYITPQDILVIHARIIDETGGSHGVRDVGLLLSAIERPLARFGGKELYKTVFDKAAVYVDSLARHHVFIDGNKRTAIAAAVRFLFINRITLNASNTDVVAFMLRVVVKKLSLKQIATWLARHSKRIR